MLSRLVTDTIRTSLEWTLQQLIEAEASALIGAGRFERTETRTDQATGIAPGCCPRPPEITGLRQGSFSPSLLEPGAAVPQVRAIRR